MQNLLTSMFYYSCLGLDICTIKPLTSTHDGTSISRNAANHIGNDLMDLLCSVGNWFKKDLFSYSLLFWSCVDGLDKTLIA